MFTVHRPLDYFGSLTLLEQLTEVNDNTNAIYYEALDLSLIK